MAAHTLRGGGVRRIRIRSNNSIGDGGASALAPGLRALTNLKTLLLS